MELTTLRYIENGDSYLMLHRVKKQNDANEGKWIGVGGHMEEGETPEACIRREIMEETGLVPRSLRFRGVVFFLSDRWEDEMMYLYTGEAESREVRECDEGELRWVKRREIFRLSLWEGDRIFLNYLLEDEPFFCLELHYDSSDELVSSRLRTPVILASGSPRRLELLRQIGIRPVVEPSEVDEMCDEKKPDKLVESLALMKARAVAARFSGNELIIGADTVVVSDGRILGKPASHEEAAEMIRSLQGHPHSVYTGVAVIRARDGAKRCFAEKTEVFVAPMNEEEILLYAGSEEPMDKAGGYGIQGSFAAFIEGIRGDYFNVMGLPLRKVYLALCELSDREAL